MSRIKTSECLRQAQGIHENNHSVVVVHVIEINELSMSRIKPSECLRHAQGIYENNRSC
jgi:hypothetical protein